MKLATCDCAGVAASSLPRSRSRAGPRPRRRRKLLVYTALETDQLKAYEEAFNKAVPDIEIKWVRDSTGVITAKLLAEKANPQADIVVGVSRRRACGVRQRRHAACRMRRRASQRSRRSTRDPKNPPDWVGDGRLGRDRLLQHGRGGEA